MMAKPFTQVLAGFIVALVLAGCAGTPQKESTGEYLDDTLITTKVKAALLNDPMVSGLAVNVETFKGVVQLSGFVKTEAEKKRAHEVAHGVKGVTKVVDDILIR